jgi:hypothetical protein
MLSKLSSKHFKEINKMNRKKTFCHSGKVISYPKNVTELEIAMKEEWS